MDEWRLQAKCRGMDPAVFFPLPVGVRTARHDDRYDPALAVCAACPVTAECAAAGEHEPEGVWGRTVPGERSTEVVTLPAPENCNNGHRLTDENTRWTTEVDRAGRTLHRWRCRVCQREANHRYYSQREATGA